jgi:peptidoglycan hydrolase CwlO-like protein
MLMRPPSPLQAKTAELQEATQEEEGVNASIKESAKAVATAQRTLAKREAQANAAHHSVLKAETTIEALTEQIVSRAACSGP